MKLGWWSIILVREIYSPRRLCQLTSLQSKMKTYTKWQTLRSELTLSDMKTYTNKLQNFCSEYLPLHLSLFNSQSFRKINQHDGIWSLLGERTEFKWNSQMSLRPRVGQMRFWARLHQVWKVSWQISNL